MDQELHIAGELPPPCSHPGTSLYRRTCNAQTWIVSMRAKIIAMRTDIDELWRCKLSSEVI